MENNTLLLQKQGGTSEYIWHDRVIEFAYEICILVKEQVILRVVKEGINSITS